MFVSRPLRSRFVTERGAHQYEFRCPHCNERVQVDADVRDLLLASGCVVCGEGLSEAAFGDRQS